MFKLLIAEDELPERRGLQALLERYYGSRIQVCGLAGSGKEALMIFREQHPDIVLMDINMPEMNGLEAAERIRNEYPDLPIVIITAYSLFDYARRAIHMGVSDYIVKPYSIKTLRQTMDRIIDKEELRRSSLEALQKPAGTDGSPQEIKGGAREKVLCESVKGYIESAYQKEISLDELSAHVGLSKFHLSRMFGETEGMGIKEYHIRIRIREAKYYLSLGYTVAEAAYAVGFRDPNYFSRIVRKYTGMTAKELIREQ